jgi:glutamate synthase domain-containing protein 2
MVFADHVSLPFRVAFPRAYRTFLEENMADRVTWIASAKLGFPDRAIVAICLGADLINIARESMLAIGCIQAQQCHTGHCPTGVTTHDPKLQRGLVPEVQADRFAHYVSSFRNELMALTHACGYRHPSEFTSEDVEISTGAAQFKTLRELEGYTPQRRSHATL